jgi:hypothetical protein
MDIVVSPAGIDTCLTQRTPVSLPAWKEANPPQAQGYTSLTSITPIIEPFIGRRIHAEGALASDTRITEILDISGSGVCRVTTTKGTLLAYCKITHLIDPSKTLQNYYVDAEKGAKRLHAKLENPMNQAYIDGLGNYLVGQLRERNITPHFCFSYGTYKGVADTYRYNITDDYESYRKYKAFWERRRQGLFKLYTRGSESLSTPASSLRSSPFTCRSYDSEKSHETLTSSIEEGAADVELESVNSFPSEKSGSTLDSHSDCETDSDCEEEDEIFAEFKNFPVILIFQERMEGSMDDLLENETAVGAEFGTPEWEERWTAWTFQVIAALCCAQGVLGFTHNDLHTNNILWSSTTEEYICYGARDGTVWRVPTYGRIFRIIDFGRAIFRVGEKWFVSDDYARGGDAAGQYSPTDLRPNPSFDLCRLAVSLIDMVFPDPPVERLDGDILSREVTREGTWTVHETESPLWNMLWSWLLDNDGCNVLRDEDGTERFPDFDLYQKISANVFGAKPQEQIRRALFSKFHVSREGVKTMYPLFC